jgi:hypothetical protein
MFVYGRSHLSLVLEGMLKGANFYIAIKWPVCGRNYIHSSQPYLKGRSLPCSSQNKSVKARGWRPRLVPPRRRGWALPEGEAGPLGLHLLVLRKGKTQVGLPLQFCLGLHPSIQCGMQRTGFAPLGFRHQKNLGFRGRRKEGLQDRPLPVQIGNGDLTLVFYARPKCIPSPIWTLPNT